MDREARRVRRDARRVGLDITGPYTGPREYRYLLWERSSGNLLSDSAGITLDEVRLEIAKHAGVPRLADARRRREWEAEK